MATKKREKRFAYWHTEHPDNSDIWIVVICEENLKGFRIVPEYGPYVAEKTSKRPLPRGLRSSGSLVAEDKAKGVAERLNARLGVSPKDARAIVETTMPVTPLSIAIAKWRGDSPKKVAGMKRAMKRSG